MANTYSQITIQAVYAVKYRQNVITREWREQLFQYTSGIIKAKGAKPLAVGGWKDHVHILFGLPVSKSISDLVGEVKSNSSRWINENGFTKGKFEWQAGFGAFSYTKNLRPVLINYIMNQEDHHRKKTFKEEYLSLLDEFNIEFDNQYLFEFY